MYHVYWFVAGCLSCIYNTVSVFFFCYKRALLSLEENQEHHIFCESLLSCYRVQYVDVA